MKSVLLDMVFEDFGVYGSTDQVTTVKQMPRTYCSLPSQSIEIKATLKSCYSFDFSKVQDIPFQIDVSTVFPKFNWQNWVSSFLFKTSARKPTLVENREYDIPVKIKPSRATPVTFRINAIRDGVFKAVKE